MGGGNGLSPRDFVVMGTKPRRGAYRFGGASISGGKKKTLFLKEFPGFFFFLREIGQLQTFVANTTSFVLPWVGVVGVDGLGGVV